MKDLEQELVKASQALENLAKAGPAPVLSEGDEMTQAEFQALLETFKTIGKDGLKKSLPQLSDKQLLLVKTVLEKATSMDAEAVKPPPAPAKEYAAEDVKSKKHDEDDEKLVKEENKNVKNQGDDSELPGQVIKSMSDDQLRAMVRRMKERNLSKAQCMGALEQYGQPKEKMEKMFDAEGFDSKPEEKPEQKPEEKKEEAQPADPQKDAPEADAAKQSDKDVKEGLKSDKDLDQGEKNPAPAPKPEEKKEEAKPPFQKSVSWTNPIAPYLESSTKRGRNAHFSVDEMIAKAEEKSVEMKKSGWASDPYAEPLRKAEGPKKVTANDLIEKGLDYDPFQLELAKARRDWKPAGTFNVKSFDEADLGFTPPEVLKKATPRGEGARGGRVIGHTTTGKPIYADPKHPEHQHFTDSDHFDASMAHTTHQMKHEEALNKPVTRGNVSGHMQSVESSKYHNKASSQHMDKIKAKDLTSIHPHLKTMGDQMVHSRKVATSAFKPKEAEQSSTKKAPEQKD